MNNQERLRELEDKLAELKARLPAHSVSAAMMIELEELEEEIEALRARASDEQG
jgi:hypothetical protein